MTFLCRRQKCASSTYRMHNRASESSYRGREVTQCHSLVWVFPWSFGLTPRLHLWWFISSHWLWIFIILILLFRNIVITDDIIINLVTVFTIFIHYFSSYHTCEKIVHHIWWRGTIIIFYISREIWIDRFFFSNLWESTDIYYKKHLFFVCRSMIYYLWSL